jgi:glucosamine--fructose-6-phosphate aminotransferase (isomerizing)
MCGIVGYVGAKPAAPVLLEGLARLEYRGYDSAGIALVTEEGELYIRKRAGKVADLRDALDGDTPPSHAGLGHTRWATHGRPNDLNAHPHTDCTGELTVIHNGIIENFIELRAELEATGHTFASETDTEAIAHLVEAAYEGDLAAAVRTALRRAHGAYALAVIHRGEPDRIVGARMNVPLVVGLGEGEAFLASDVAAVLAHTRRVIFLEEGDVADIRPERVVITDLLGRDLERPSHEIDWDLEAAEKGGYEHFMLKEVHEQPEAILAAITGRLHEHEVRVPELDPLLDRLAGIERVELIACGSAAYASAVGHRRHPVRRDGGHAGADPAGSAAWLRGRRHHEHGRLRDHPRGRRRALLPGRPGDRGRGYQDVRDPGHHAAPGGGSPGQDPRPPGPAA